jgi:hypothetical protein
MKRAIVWFCWGKRFVADAIVSARATAAVEADRLIIVDRENAALAETSGVFNTILPVDLEFHNNLEKSRLIDLLPRSYDSYLYLDSDTRVFGDLSLGFESAETYGVAIAPEPNYDLGAFFGFGSVMAKLGIEPRAQLLYNTGVFFFALNETVRRLLETWRDLCARLGPESGIASDQAFLSLAFEQHRFRPYVLSPSYNYRGFGEHAVGAIRIWHSKFQPPADLNAFDDAWPGRRFMRGRRLPPEGAALEPAKPAGPLPRPWLPQGMLRLRLREFITSRGASAGWFLMEHLREIAAGAGNRAANEALIEELGIDLCGRDDTYYSESIDYYLGLLAAYLDRPKEMAEYLRRSHTMPSFETDEGLFSDHVNTSHAIRLHRMRAIEEGLPAIAISAMPCRAGLAFGQSLARLLEVPLLRVTAGPAQRGYLVPCWLDMFLEGGAVALDDFPASDFNLGVLAPRRLPGLFVLVRDPRAAARSFVVNQSGGATAAGGTLDERVERACIDHFIPWLSGWIVAAERRPFVTWLRYRDILADRAAGVRAIAAALSTESPTMRRFAETTVAPYFETAFINEDDDCWRRDVGRAARERMWAACPLEIRKLLNLEP